MVNLLYGARLVLGGLCKMITWTDLCDTLVLIWRIYMPYACLILRYVISRDFNNRFRLVASGSRS